ncbi:hypothetical protein HYV83_01770 [Candidatus Woesearchaeota archaeon]|nr:hypothetical protein [Candidatus Woesearchaeota archaeon]
MATAIAQESISLIDVIIKKVDGNAASVNKTLVEIGGLNFEVQVHDRNQQLLWSRVEEDSIVIRAGYVRNGPSKPTNSLPLGYTTLVFNRKGAFLYAVDYEDHSLNAKHLKKP